MRALAQPVAAWLAATLAAFRPHALPGGRRDALLGCVGVGLGLLITEWLAHHWLGGTQPGFLLPMGASAVLLFMLPASPLAQPWSVLGGNVVSALVGVALYRWLGDAAWAAALGGALAVAAMRALRCLHPPGGAMALTAVLGDPGVHHLGWGFVHGPVLVNSAAMLLVALVFHRLTGRRYPHQPASTAQTHGTQDPPPTHRTGPGTKPQPSWCTAGPPSTAVSAMAPPGGCRQRNARMAPTARAPASAAAQAASPSQR